jgi:hypothetical protein
MFNELGITFAFSIHRTFSVRRRKSRLSMLCALGEIEQLVMLMAFIAYGQIPVRLFDLLVAHAGVFTLMVPERYRKKRLQIWNYREEHLRFCYLGRSS